MTLLPFRSREHARVMATFDRIDALLNQMDADIKRLATYSGLSPEPDTAARLDQPSRVNPDRAANLIGEQA